MLCSITTAGGPSRRSAPRPRGRGRAGVSVSIDGLRESHDAVRALQGSFDAAMASIDNLRRVGMPITANTQINRWNIDHLEAVFDILVAEGIRAWLMQITTAMGRAGDEDDLLLEPYQVLDVIPRLARLKVRAAAAKIRMCPATTSATSARTRRCCAAPSPTSTAARAAPAG